MIGRASFASLKLSRAAASFNSAIHSHRDGRCSSPPTRAGFLKRLPAREFAREAGVIIGDINYIHPFREGNGRTQAQYLKQLAEQAGHPLDLRRIDPTSWIEASTVSHMADYKLMGEVIYGAIVNRSD
jgi:fido (protein-threonine AMPylation protein)